MEPSASALRRGSLVYLEQVPSANVAPVQSSAPSHSAAQSSMVMSGVVSPVGAPTTLKPS